MLPPAPPPSPPSPPTPPDPPPLPPYGSLIAASSAGNVTLVKVLLAAGVDKNEMDGVSNSAGGAGRDTMGLGCDLPTVRSFYINVYFPWVLAYVFMVHAEWKLGSPFGQLQWIPRGCQGVGGCWRRSQCQERCAINYNLL